MKKQVKKPLKEKEIRDQVASTRITEKDAVKLEQIATADGKTKNQIVVEALRYYFEFRRIESEKNQLIIPFEEIKKV